jgi:hypothetical protein
MCKATIVTPKEKAMELVQKYMLHTPVGFYIEDAKKCAIIAVDLVLSNRLFWKEDYKYWNDVKEEINKL